MALTGAGGAVSLGAPEPEDAALAGAEADGPPAAPPSGGVEVHAQATTASQIRRRGDDSGRAGATAARVGVDSGAIRRCMAREGIAGTHKRKAGPFPFRRRPRCVNSPAMMDASRGAASATWEADADGAEAVLCLHGLTSTPYEMQPVAEALARRGLHVLVPRLLGHGTRPECLAHTRWSDWLGSARQAFDRLAARHERVFIVGLSMGALLGVVLAHERGARCGGLVLMGTPLRLDTRTQLAFRLIRALPLAEALPPYEKADGPDVSDPAVAAAMPSYDRVPLAAAASLVDGQREAIARLPRLRTPTLVLHGRNDHVAPVSNARRLYDSLRMPRRRLVIYPRSWHILPLDVESENVVRDVVEFVDALRVSPRPLAGAPAPRPKSDSAETRP